MATETALEADLAAFLGSDPEVMGNPYPLYDRLRETAPVYWHEAAPAHFVTTYDHVLWALQNADKIGQGGYQRGSRAEAILRSLSEADQVLLREVWDFEAHYVSRNDGEEHDRLRRIAHRAFTPRRIKLLEGSVQRFVDELLAPWQEGGTVDVITELGMKLPTMVICDMLSVPAEDRERVRNWADTISRNRGGSDVDALRAGHRAIQEFRAYVGELVEKLRAEGDGTELALTLLEAAEDGERLTEEELVAMFVILLFAGSETTTNLIGNGLRQLMLHRDQWERLCAEPELVDSAVEELLRYDPPVQFLLKLAEADVELGGKQVRKGETVILSLGAANRDPEQFPDPHRLDIARKPNRHLALGFGPHFCLGNALARLEGQIVFRELSQRWPGLRLAVEPDELVWHGNAMLRGLRELPIDLGGPARTR